MPRPHPRARWWRDTLTLCSSLMLMHLLLCPTSTPSRDQIGDFVRGLIARFVPRVEGLYYRITGNFGGELNLGILAVYNITTAKLKSAKISYSHIIRMAILYRTAKFKSANILAIAIWGSTAKFNSRQYFRL